VRSLRAIPGTFVVSSANGAVLQAITGVSVGEGRVEFDRIAEDGEVSSHGGMSDDELLIAFLEGRAHRIGEQT
jgi:hypothetical protein